MNISRFKVIGNDLRFIKEEIEKGKCDDCSIPEYIKVQNTTIKNNTGFCSHCKSLYKGDDD